MLSFDKLSFSQVARLQQKYKTYYQSWSSQHQATSQGGTAWEMDNSNLGDASLSLMDIVGDDKQEFQSEKQPP